MSKLRESRLEEQVDHHVDKILQILCKVLISEVTTEVVQTTTTRESMTSCSQNVKVQEIKKETLSACETM